MGKFEFNRGDDFECPVEVFEFVYSDWQAADKVTGGHWNVVKSDKTFRGGWSGFWGEFELLTHDPCTGKKDGVFTYIVNLGGWLINGSGKLIIRYCEKEDKTVIGHGSVELKLRGLMALFSFLFKGKLNDLTSKLVEYQHKACVTIAQNPDKAMEFLSSDQQKELKKCLSRSYRRNLNVLETTLQILSANDTYVLSFATPRSESKGSFKDQGAAEGILENFDKLVKTANQWCAAPRSGESKDISNDMGLKFRKEITLLGRNLYERYISGDVATSLRFFFTNLDRSFRRNSTVRVGIKAEGRYAQFPWELMHDGDAFLCIKTAAFRATGRRAFESSLDVKGVLIVVSDPFGNLKTVLNEGENILKSIEDTGEVEARLVYGDAATKESVIAEIESGRYQVIHYSGHSTFDEETAGSSYLLMQDGKHLFADELARLSEANDLRLVFLNSCSSGQSKMDLSNLRGLASAFVYTGVPYVIGMNWDVTDDGATLLSKKFYEQYIITRDPIESLRRAREYVGRITDWEDPAWASPVIYAGSNLRTS